MAGEPKEALLRAVDLASLRAGIWLVQRRLDTRKCIGLSCKSHAKSVCSDFCSPISQNPMCVFGVVGPAIFARTSATCG